MKRRIFLPFVLAVFLVIILTFDNCTSSHNPQGIANKNVPETGQHKAKVQNKFMPESSVSGAGLKTISSAELCGDCHRTGYETWKTSSHAHAMDSRLFQDIMHLAEADLGASVRQTCFSCHSPLASETGDLDLQKKVSWEGVTCDYCHSIRDVSMAGPNPRAELKFNLIKAGPWKELNPSVDGAIFSEVYTSSKLCATCHEYQNTLGFPVMTTYSEW